VFIVVNLYFVIDSVRKLLDTPSYIVKLGDGWNWLKIVSNEGLVVVVLNFRILVPQCQFIWDI
jgi:hypothetical protein